MSEITLKDIVETYLKTHSYDGLTDSRNVCGCYLDDLMPCDEPSMYCVAAVKQPCDYTVDASTINDRERVECSQCEGVKGQDISYHLVAVDAPEERLEDIS